MADCTEDSTDASSSVGDEERVRRLFQACDGDGDGYIDCHDLLNICRELNLEDSIEDLMKELGADEHGRISYQEFLRRRLALRPEIEALKGSRQQLPEDLPNSSENSLGEGKMTWEFDSGARDLSPEPHSFQQLIGTASHPASGSLLDLAQKLNAAALASLKNEISRLSNKILYVTAERDNFEKSFREAQIERFQAEQKLEEERELHEEQLTELHSVIAELTKKVQHQRSMVIKEEEDVSEADENEASAVVESQTAPLNEELNEVEPTLGLSTSSNENEEDEEEEEEEEQLDKTPEEEIGLKGELAQVKAENAMLHERLKRALSDLETICSLNSKKRDVPENFEVVRVARVSSPSRVIDRTSPSLVSQTVASPVKSNKSKREKCLPVAKIAERVKLKKIDNPITGSDISAFGVCHTKIAEHLVSDLKEESDLQELSRGDAFSQKQLELEAERQNCRLEHLKAQNTVLALTLEECKAQCARLSLLLGKYESNAIASQLALKYTDLALELTESLLSTIETEKMLILTIVYCCPNPDSPESLNNRIVKWAAESRNEARTHAKEILMKIAEPGETVNPSEWNTLDETKLKEQIARLKIEKSKIKDTIVELESPHIESLPHVSSPAAKRNLDLETAVLVQELMNLREDKAELKARIHLLEKERASQELRMSAQNAHLQALVQSLHHLQDQMIDEKESSDQANSCHKKDVRLREKMEELVGTLDKVTRNSELRYQENAELVLDLRAANTALVSTLDKCKKKYQSRLKKLETQMLSLVEGHEKQMNELKDKIAILEKQNQPRPDCLRK